MGCSEADIHGSVSGDLNGWGADVGPLAGTLDCSLGTVSSTDEIRPIGSGGRVLVLFKDNAIVIIKLTLLVEHPGVKFYRQLWSDL